MIRQDILILNYWKQIYNQFFSLLQIKKGAEKSTPQFYVLNKNVNYILSSFTSILFIAIRLINSLEKLHLNLFLHK